MYKMNRNDFNKCIEEQLERVKSVLIKKGQEYSTDDEPLHNFYEGSKVSRMSPEQVAYMYACKHFVSITDMLFNDKNYPLEVWHEKLGDMKNYLFLIEAIITENDKNSQ